MVFTSLDYLVFATVSVAAYWMLPSRRMQNGFLLVVSYVFYGYVHPWLCLLLAGTSLTNYGAALAMERYPRYRKQWLGLAVTVTLAQLAAFKYHGFFSENVYLLAEAFGLKLSPVTIDILLPAGISFYSFQTIGYTVDVYRNRLAPRKSFLEFALFVAFFPQLVAGPIERAPNLLPQFETKRTLRQAQFFSAFPLLITGYLKKLVVADNVALYADKVFALSSPSLLVLTAGSAAFALQIYMDFAAYTDIARGSARLLGFELMRNFDRPYASVSPSDFWRRWHISFSTWIRDYLYIPLGGSRTRTRWGSALVVLVTFGLSGLWHGADWHFVAWGLYHGALIMVYRALGLGAGWHPEGAAKRLAAISVMLLLTLFGWTLFRAPSLSWLFSALVNASLAPDTVSLAAGTLVLLWTGVYALPTLAIRLVEEEKRRFPMRRALVLGLFLFLIALFAPERQQDFIYFQF